MEIGRTDLCSQKMEKEKKAKEALEEALQICREKGLNEKTLFQRSFHDHVIRGDEDYQKIAEYIDTNVLRWEKDCFYNN